MEQIPNPTLATPLQVGQLQDVVNSLTKLLSQIPDSLITLRREFRGEALYTDKDGGNHWVQISKPVFVLMNIEKGIPLKKKEKMPWGEIKEVYLPNDEAIDEVLSMLKFMGINQISPIGFNTADNYLDDLLEFECKLAAVLCLKQKEWGLDKELLPMIMTKIKTIVQDIRSMSIEGKTLRALQTTVQEMFQSVSQGNKQGRFEKSSPYG